MKEQNGMKDSIRKEKNTRRIEGKEKNRRMNEKKKRINDGGE